MKKIILGILFLITIVGFNFISPKIINAADAACYQCKCTSFSCAGGAPCGEECAVFAVRSASECTRSACTSHGFCSRFPEIGRSVYSPPVEYPACSGNRCSDACVNAVDPPPDCDTRYYCCLGGTKDIPGNPIADWGRYCVDCLSNEMKVSVQTILDSGNAACWSQQALNYLCSGKFDAPNAARCAALQQPGGACNSVCGGVATTSTPTPVSSDTPTPVATPVPTSWTAFYRVSTAPFGTNNDPEWKVYTDDAGMLEDLDFGNVPIGTKLAVYAQFKSTTGVVNSVSKEIEYIGPEPVISSIKCGYSPTGIGTDLKISGQNFGNQGPKSKVNFNNKIAQIISWGNQTASTSAETSAISVKINDKLKENLAIPVFIETADGRRAPKSGQVSCTISLTTVNFVALPECRPPVKFSSEVRVQIYENTVGAKPVYDKKVLIGNDGTMGWAPSSLPNLEVNKNYVMIIKGNKGVAIKKEFTALPGSTILDDIKLPVGDIAPPAAPDNTVNSLDYAELKREWNVVTDTTRAGDFNLDSRINSVDYSCMRNSFNATGAKFLTGQ